MEKIHYEELVHIYNEELTTILRGFKSTHDFLETWVPDEDDIKSLLNLLESAESAGAKEICVYLGPQTLKKIEIEQLKRVAGSLGIVKTQAYGDGLDLEVSFKK